jgi:hypothetical protein
MFHLFPLFDSQPLSKDIKADEICGTFYSADKNPQHF